MDYPALRKTVMRRLKRGLTRPYHNVEHIRDVIRSAEYIALKEGVSGHDLTLVKTAALLHDAGFLFSDVGHEEDSCALAAEYLPRYGYSQEDLQKVQKMIMATRLPQQPNSLLDEILADADLDYLGRDDFFTYGNRLYQELLEGGVVQNEEQWNAMQAKFLQDHRYFTRTSQSLREKKKAENLQKVTFKLMN